MKKIFTLTTVFLFALLTSCSGDDNSNTNNGAKNKIVGSWVYTGYNDQQGTYHADDTDPCYSFTVTFNGNKTGNEVDKDCKAGDETENFKWDTPGNNVYTLVYDNPEMNENVEDNAITVNFVNDNKITVTYAGSTSTEVFTKK